MNIRVIETRHFMKRMAGLIKTHKIKLEDYTAFKHSLCENPEFGDIIQGTGGLRKVRLKSASKGTSGGFRVCYYFQHKEIGEIFLITIYPKNEKEDLSPDEKKDFKKLIEVIKKG